MVNAEELMIKISSFLSGDGFAKTQKAMKQVQAEQGKQQTYYQRVAQAGVQSNNQIANSYSAVIQRLGPVGTAINGMYNIITSGASKVVTAASSIAPPFVRSWTQAASSSNVLNNAFNSVQSGVGRVVKSAGDIASKFGKAFSQAGKSASDFITSLEGIDGVIAGVLGGIGVQNIGEMIFGNTAKAEVNKILLGNMTQTEQGAKKLFNTIDQATNKTLVSMQSVIPAVNAFKAATGATESTLNAVSPGVAQFGSYVYAMTGSAAQAEGAMFDLSKGIKGAYASLDQYGITEDSLMATELWTGKTDDVEGYIEAVNAVTGSTDELMGTFQGLQATITKTFSVAGKTIGNAMLPVLKGLAQGFLDLNKATGGALAAAILLVGGGLSAVLVTAGAIGALLPVIISGIGILTPGLTAATAAKLGFAGSLDAAKDSLLSFITRQETAIVKEHGFLTAIKASISGKNEDTAATMSLTGAIQSNSIVQAINNRIHDERTNILERLSGASNTATKQIQIQTDALGNQKIVEVNSTNTKQKLTNTTIQQSIADSLAAAKLRLLNGETSVAALYEANYEKAKQRSIITSIRNAASRATEAVVSGVLAAKEGVLTVATNVGSAAATAYAFVRERVTLANIKGAAVSTLAAAKTLLVAAAERIASAATGAYIAVKKLEIATHLKSIAISSALHAKNLLVAVGTGILAAATTAYNFIVKGGILTTLKDIAVKGLQSLANLKTAVSAGIMTAAQIGLNAAMMAMPYVLVIAGVIALAAAFKHLYETFPDFKNGIDQIIGGLKELFGALMSGDFNKIGDIFKNAFAELPNWLGNINQQIEPAIKSMSDAFSNWASNIDWLSELQNGFGAVSSWIVGAAKNIGNWFVEGLKGISEGLSSWLKGGGEGGQAAGQAIYDGIVGWWNTNGGTVVEILSTIFLEIIPLMGEIGWKLIQALGIAIGQGLQWVGQQIWIGLSSAIEGFLTYLTTLPGQILTFLIQVSVGIIQWGLQLAMNGLMAGAQFVQSLITFFSPLASIIGTFLLAAIARVVSFGSNLLSRFRSAFSNAVNTAKSFITQLPGIVWQEMMNIVAKIGQAAGAIFAKVKEVFGNVVKWAMEALGMSSPGTISKMMGKEMGWTLEHIKNMANPARITASELGKKIVSGFGNPVLPSIGNEGIDPYEYDPKKSGSLKWPFIYDTGDFPISTSAGALVLKESSKKDSGVTVGKIEVKNTINVDGASGDPEEIAAQIEQKLASSLPADIMETLIKLLNSHNISNGNVN